jgi:serine/threonine-protein phosphatase 4 regulatory subunit 1
VDFFVTTTSGTTNKDVCYYSAYNLPAFVDVLGPACWPRFRPIYMKLTNLKDAKILRTLGHSLHELARLLGPDVTEADLTPVMLGILSESNLFKEAKNGALSNLHAFMADLPQPTRDRFLPFILQENESVQLDWREKVNLATNVGNFCLLFDVATVFDKFLPLFF